MQQFDPGGIGDAGQVDLLVALAQGGAELVELCAPFLAQGGLLVALRRGDLDAEIQAAAPAFKALKLWSRVPLMIDVDGLRDGRGLVVGEKYAPTPETYPRKAGLASKRPLSA